MSKAERNLKRKQPDSPSFPDDSEQPKKKQKTGSIPEFLDAVQAGKTGGYLSFPYLIPCFTLSLPFVTIIEEVRRYISAGFDVNACLDKQQVYWTCALILSVCRFLRDFS
jgi:hypothetical protein